MSISVRSQAGQPNYMVNQYVVDTDADIANLPTSNTEVAPGSTAIVTSSGNQYILNNSYSWVLWTSGGGSPTGDVHYIWDGGEVI